MNETTMQNLTNKEREQYFQWLYSQMRCVNDKEREEWDKYVDKQNMAYRQESVSK